MAVSLAEPPVPREPVVRLNLPRPVTSDPLTVNRLARRRILRPTQMVMPSLGSGQTRRYVCALGRQLSKVHPEHILAFPINGERCEVAEFAVRSSDVNRYLTRHEFRRWDLLPERRYD